MGWTKGDQMSDRNQRAACRMFVHRMTIEAQRSHPGFAERMKANGYRMPDRTDKEWLANTEFYITQQGEISARHNHCRTSWGTSI